MPKFPTTFALSTAAGDMAELARQELGENFTWFSKLLPEQIEIIEVALRDLAMLGIELVAHPDNAPQIQAEIAFVRSTLTSEASLSAVNAEAAVVKTISDIIGRGVSAFTSAALGGIAGPAISNALTDLIGAAGRQIEPGEGSPV